jgi:histidyl-tRNA synthetase
VAEKSGAALAVLVGEKERASGTVVVKTMQSRSQEELPREGLAAALRARL